MLLFSLCCPRSIPSPPSSFAKTQHTSQTSPAPLLNLQHCSIAEDESDKNEAVCEVDDENNGDTHDVTVEELLETVNDLVEAESSWLKLITHKKL